MMYTKNFNDEPFRHYRIIVAILLTEICLYFISGIHLVSLQGNTFISFEQDPLLWFVYFTGVPQFILGNSLLCYVINSSILLLLIILILNPLNRWVALVLAILLLIFYSIFTAHLGHRNYQSGYLFVLLPFLFAKRKNRQIVFEMTRYFLLFFYVSAAFFKIQSGSLFSGDHFSHAVINQFTPYFLEQSFSVRTYFNLYLLTHPYFSQSIYVIAALCELLLIIGFFTKKFDRQLALLILIFHFVNWFIMDIAPIGQIAFICTLFYSNKFCWKTLN